MSQRRCYLNIKAISTELKDGIGIIKLVTDNEDITRQTLTNARLDFSEYEIVPVRLKDKPGELARLSRALAELNVDIESVFLLNRDGGTSELAFKVNDLKKAKDLFG